MASFTHLQVQTGYSLMSSTITIEKLIDRSVELSFSALALTDHHVLYGVMPFYQACQRKGIKPLIGMTVMVEEADEPFNRLILLAKNNQGYQQLVKLSTEIQLHSRENVTKEELVEYTSANVIGILPVTSPKVTKTVQHESKDAFLSYIKTWTPLFDSGDFYVGVSYFGTVEERERNHYLKQLQEEASLSVVAVQDVHYLQQKDVTAYDCLQAIRDGKKWSTEVLDTKNKHHHLRSVSEMEDAFSDWPHVLMETAAIRDRCTVTFDHTKRLLPSFPVPEQMGAHDYLQKLCWSRVETLYTDVTEQVRDRLAYELKVIESMQFSDYFLIVSDFIAFAKNHQIAVGPGRGSAAGSLVAYVLGITGIDPLKYGLLFERFLNPERVTMPDIDVDISDYRRDEVIQYVRDKYGSRHVAQIITFGTFAARSLLRELFKVMEIDQQDAQYILRAFPAQTTNSLVEQMKASPELSRYIKQSQTLTQLFTVALVLEGLPRHTSTHAAGVVISEHPLIEHVPLMKGANEVQLTQFPMNDLEEIGLLKMDFLGLRNLTLIERIITSISYKEKQTIRIDQLPDDDGETFALLRKGLTNGVFQLESQGMKDVLMKLKPTSFEDIVAVNALYRPGPMAYIPDFIARKHGNERVSYPHSDLRPILADTYGVLVYQEQIMQMAHTIAGFSLGQADILRRAVSKKKSDVIASQKQKFIQGCLNNGYRTVVAEEIFAWIVKFSNYGFNRSHAVAYSMIAYQIAYLKAHYPVYFFAEILSLSSGQQDKTIAYIKEAKACQVDVRPPSINASHSMYTVEDGQIRMGLLAIKGIGYQVVKEIIRVRSGKAFRSLFDFCLRVSQSIVNRQTLEVLISAGAFDETHDNRASLLASIDQAMEQGELFREFQDQSSLFDDQLELAGDYVQIEDFSVMKKLTDEKELLGVYVTSHPFFAERSQFRKRGLITIHEAIQQVGKRGLRIAAIVQSIRIIRTKRGESMAFLTVGDETTDVDAVVFPDVFREARSLLNEDASICLEGKVESRNNRIQWVVSHVSPLYEDLERNRLFIKISKADSESALRLIKTISQRFPGDTPVLMYTPEANQTFKLANDYKMDPIPACLTELRHQFGSENVVFANG